MTKIRLQVALAKAGIASRRLAARIIESGRVKVNGKSVCARGFRVDVSKDAITVGRRKLSFEKAKHYYILNKPAGVISTVTDEKGRRKVSDYVSAIAARLYPVGRLDKDTTGLILLTDDGELTYRLTHPKFEINRIYEVRVRGAVRGEDLLRLKSGLRVKGKPARAEKVIFKKRTPSFSVILMTLREGRKREVRRMFEELGYFVYELKRIAYGPVKLKGVRQGEVRPLTAHEVKMLKECVGLS